MTKQATFNFEAERKIVCQELAFRLRNPKLTSEERKKILKEVSELVSKIPV